jgi:hypothetical protein
MRSTSAWPVTVNRLKPNELGSVVGAARLPRNCDGAYAPGVTSVAEASHRAGGAPVRQANLRMPVPSPSAAGASSTLWGRRGCMRGAGRQREAGAYRNRPSPSLNARQRSFQRFRGGPSGRSPEEIRKRRGSKSRFVSFFLGTTTAAVGVADR